MSLILMLIEKQIKQMGRQNNKLFENIRKYEEKEAKQQKSKIYGQKLVKGTKNKEKSTQLYNS